MLSPGTGHSLPGVDHGLLTALVLAWAQERADQVTEAANAEVDKMLNQARVHGAQLLSEAQVKAQDMVNEARTRVESMLGNARTTAQAVERQSREKAMSLAQHATHKHAEILELNHVKSLLENAIFDLQTFEQQYRTQVAIYVQSLLDELGESGSAASADPLCIQQDLVGSGLGARGETGQSPLSPR
jgi:cell division septum initiation protein DivIVA